MKKIVLRFLLFFIFLFFILFIVGIIQRIKPYRKSFSKVYYFAHEQNAIFGENILIDIPPNVKSYVSNKDFVLVIQNPKYIKDEMYNYNDSYSYENGLNNDYYWIIILNTNTVIGPLLYNDFIDNTKKVGVSEDLIAKLLNKQK